MMLSIFEEDTIRAKFDAFNTKHPEVYRELVKLARQWKQAGHSKLGIAALFERLRWEWHMSGVQSDDGYKLSNNFKAHYARLIMEQEPDLDGIFNIRPLKAL